MNKPFSLCFLGLLALANAAYYIVTPWSSASVLNLIAANLCMGLFLYEVFKPANRG